MELEYRSPLENPPMSEFKNELLFAVYEYRELRLEPDTRAMNGFINYQRTPWDVSYSNRVDRNGYGTKRSQVLDSASETSKQIANLPIVEAENLIKVTRKGGDHAEWSTRQNGNGFGELGRA